MKKKIAVLSVLWVLICGVWIVGLNWTRWITGSGDPISRAAEADPGVIYTLYGSDPAEGTPEDGPAPGLQSADGAKVETPAEADPESAPADASSSDRTAVPEEADDGEDVSPGETVSYILNTNTKKIHLPDCPSIADIKEKNRAGCEDPEAALAKGYEWCKRCHG